MNLRPQKELYRQLSFISYYFHWDLDRTLALPHLEREKFCREISQITGTSEGALKASYHIALEKIKAFLREKPSND